MELIKWTDHVEAKEPFHRKMLFQTDGSKAVLLTLQPGQFLPPHQHPGCSVYVQVLSGKVTVKTDHATCVHTSEHLLQIDGEESVGIRNESREQAVVSIILAAKQKP